MEQIGYEENDYKMRPECITIGMKGTRVFSTGCGRNYWNGFTVINRNKSGRTITVKYDSEPFDTEILTYRRDKVWRKKGKGKKSTGNGDCNRYGFGVSITGHEEGVF